MSTKREHRQLEAVGEVHQPHGLAVALRARDAEIVLDAGGGVVALLVAEHQTGAPAKAAEAADDRLVVAKIAVALQLDEVVIRPAM